MASVRDSPLYERLSRILSRERKAAGLKQVELAKRLERPQSFVSKYETGEKRLDVVELIEVARGIGCSARSVVDELSKAAAASAVPPEAERTDPPATRRRAR